MNQSPSKPVDREALQLVKPKEGVDVGEMGDDTEEEVDENSFTNAPFRKSTYGKSMPNPSTDNAWNMGSALENKSTKKHWGKIRTFVKSSWAFHSIQQNVQHQTYGRKRNSSRGRKRGASLGSICGEFVRTASSEANWMGLSPSRPVDRAALNLFKPVDGKGSNEKTFAPISPITRNF